MPPQLPSPYADEGTVAHLVCEWGLRTGRDAHEFVGSKAVQVHKGDEYRFEFESDARIMKGWTITKNVIEVTEEMAEAVQIYLDAVRFDMATFGLTLQDIKIEHKFHLTSIHPDAFGTNDCNIPVLFDRVIVYDYKHGKGVTVDAEENKQLMYYALGACQEGDFEQVEIVIVQPRVGGDPIRRWTLSVTELERFAAELKEKIEATRQPKADLIAGPWCKKTFCPAMAVCPAIIGSVERETQLAFREEKPMLPKPDTMSMDLLRKVLDNMETLDTWLRSVEAYAETMANQGQKISGYKLVQGRMGNRKWKDEAEVEAYFGPDCLEQKVMSPAKMEKLVKDNKEMIKDINRLTIRAEGKIILVPESDPREAVAPALSQMFQDEGIQ